VLVIAGWAWTSRTAAPPSGAAASDTLRLRLVEARALEAARTLAVTVEVFNDGAGERLIAPRETVRLLRRAAAPLAPTDSMPAFDTIEPGQSRRFVLRFDAPRDSAQALEFAPVGAPATRLDLP
jgi:hypothetical protein